MANDAPTGPSACSNSIGPDPLLPLTSRDGLTWTAVESMCMTEASGSTASSTIFAGLAVIAENYSSAAPATGVFDNVNVTGSTHDHDDECGFGFVSRCQRLFLHHPSLTTLIALALSAQLLSTAALARTQADDDYYLGARVAACIAARCQVFRGYLAIDSPNQGEPVPVRVEESLFGPPVESDTVVVPWERDFIPPDQPGRNHFSVWLGIKRSKGTPVTVVLALGDGYFVRKGDPVVITSSDREAGIIRSLTEQTALLEKSPLRIYDAVASLSQTVNPALGGYLVGILNLSNTLLKHYTRDQLADLSLQMLANPGLPPHTAQEFALSLVIHYKGLTSDRRMEIVQRLTELAQQQEQYTAIAGFDGLTRIMSFDDSVKAGMPETTLDALATAYRALVRKGSMRRNQDWETRLGIPYEPPQRR